MAKVHDEGGDGVQNDTITVYATCATGTNTAEAPRAHQRRNLGRRLLTANCRTELTSPKRAIMAYAALRHAPRGD